MREIWTAEFVGEEPTLELDVEVKGQTTMDAFDDEATDHIITYIIISPNGLVEFSRSLKGLVETSLNMGVVSTDEDHVKVRYQMRSSFESKKQEMREEIERCCKAVGAEAVINGEYPAWQYNPESKLQKLMSDIYEDMYGKKAVVFATTAGWNVVSSWISVRDWIAYLWDRICWMYTLSMKNWILLLQREHGII